MSEGALSHTASDKVEAAYRRGNMVERRRQMMEAWAKYCAGKTVGGNNVVAIGAAATHAGSRFRPPKAGRSMKSGTFGACCSRAKHHKMRHGKIDTEANYD